MRLPRAERATIDPRKVSEYLFNRANPDGWAKGAFFERFGFRAHDSEELAAALLRHGQENPVTHSAATPYGEKWETTGPIISPDGRNPVIRTAWHQNRGEEAPHFVSVSLRRRKYEDPGI